MNQFPNILYLFPSPCHFLLLKTNTFLSSTNTLFTYFITLKQVKSVFLEDRKVFESIYYNNYLRDFFCIYNYFININPFCTTLDLQLSFYRPLCYNSRAHCPLLQCVRTTSDILAGSSRIWTTEDGMISNK